MNLQIYPGDHDLINLVVMTLIISFRRLSIKVLEELFPPKHIKLFHGIKTCLNITCNGTDSFTKFTKPHRKIICKLF